jgi:hypothetical protein
VKAIRSVHSLSVYPNPAGVRLVAILKAYFDDSGDDVSQPVLTIGGYLSDIESWGKFDQAWKETLDSFHVPYLHMKEFGEPDGVYKELKQDADRLEAFLKSLVDVICKHTRFCTHATVLIDDLKRFNRDHGLALNAYGLAVYGCLMGLQLRFSNQPIEVIFDKFGNAGSRIQKGIDYAESDTLQPLNPRVISATHARDDESCKTILPLQAADLFSWEMRKCCIEHESWIDSLGPPYPSPRGAAASYNRWATEFIEEKGRPPRQRKSFAALRDGQRPLGYVFNYDNLKLLKDIHRNGWKLTKRRRLTVFSA